MMRFHVALVAATVAGLPLTAAADPAYSKVIPVHGAPIAVTRCSYNTDAQETRANVTNLTAIDLLNVSVRFQFFDDEGVIGESVISAAPQPMLASGDSGSYTSWIMHPFSDPVGVLKYTTCRIEAASFTRGRKWAYGQSYPGKLSAINRSPQRLSDAIDDRAANQAGGGDTGGTTTWPSSLAVKTGESWITNVPDNLPVAGLFVHVRVSLVATGQLDVSPAEFRVHVTLPNGATKTYSPLLRPAPLVLHGGVLTYTGDQNQLGPSVAPDEDLGAIGTMSLQPNVPVSTILTYKIDSMSPTDTIHIALVR